MRMNGRRWAVLLPAVALAACGRSGAPTGQVVARVGGTEITTSELNLELRGRGADAGDRRVRNAVLQDMIDQRLLAEKAKEAGVDKQPQFVLLRDRGDRALLVQSYVERIGGGAVTDQAVDAFVRDNAAALSQRRLVSVDSISFPTVTDRSLADRISAARTLDEIQGLLTGARLPFRRGYQTFDGVQTPPELMARLATLKLGDVFVFRAPGQSLAGTILKSEIAPLTDVQQREYAQGRLQQKQTQDAVALEVRRARASAKIAYQKGFEPPAPARPAPKS